MFNPSTGETVDLGGGSSAPSGGTPSGGMPSGGSPSGGMPSGGMPSGGGNSFAAGCVIHYYNGGITDLLRNYYYG